MATRPRTSPMIAIGAFLILVGTFRLLIWDDHQRPGFSRPLQAPANLRAVIQTKQNTVKYSSKTPLVRSRGRKCSGAHLILNEQGIYRCVASVGTKRVSRRSETTPTRY